MKPKWIRPILLLRTALVTLTLLAPVLQGCSDRRSSTIEQEAQPSIPAEQLKSYGDALGIESPKSAIESGKVRFRLDAGQTQYADAAVMIQLKGSAVLVESSNIAKQLWQQEDGPEAIILNPDQLTTQVLLPQTAAEDQLQFRLIAADPEGYTARDAMRVNVLPLDAPLRAPAIVLSETENAAIFTIERTDALYTASAVFYQTQNGDAVAGEDYLPQNGVLEFDDETGQAQIRIDLLEDEVGEANEYFSVVFSSQSPAFTQRAYAVIQDNDNRGSASSSSSSSASSSASSTSSSSSSGASSSSTSSSSTSSSSTSSSSSSSTSSSSTSSSASTSTTSSSSSSSSSSGLILGCNIPGAPQIPNIPACRDLQTTGNPYAGAQIYLDPDYVAQVEKSQVLAVNQPDMSAAMDIIKQQPTAIWLDTVSMLEKGDAVTGRRSLREHLAAARELQHQNIGQNNLAPLAVQVVVLQNPIALPGDSTATSLDYTAEDLSRYKTEVIEPLKALAEAYPSLRLVIVLEPHTIPELLMASSFCNTELQCQKIRDSQQLVDSALQTLSETTSQNIYIYLGIGHSAWLTSSTSLQKIPTWLNALPPTTLNAIKGFATNTAAYVPLREDMIIYKDNATSGPYLYRGYIDEKSLIEQLQTVLTEKMPNANLGFITDTSRNGWGGPGRPDAAGGIASRLDKRLRREHWCNVALAGIGERFTLAPENIKANVHAYTWLKQPGISDGASPEETNPENRHACDPENGDALANSPQGGLWFENHFAQLITNAWPALIQNEEETTAEFVRLGFALQRSPELQASIEGEVAPGSAIKKIDVLINGILAEPGLLKTAINNTGFSLTVSDLPVQPRILSPNNFPIDQTHVEIQIIATDEQDMKTSGLLTYSTSDFLSGTEVNDLVIYDGNITGTYFTYDGDDFILPKNPIEWRAPINTGAGNDTVLMYGGVALTDAGDDTIEMLEHTGSCSCQTNGGSGSDLYVYGISSNEGRTVQIIEDTTDLQSKDRLQLLTVASTDAYTLDIVSNFSSGIDLVLTLPSKDRIIIQRFLNGSGEFNNTIEEIEFSDGVILIGQEIRFSFG